jgi:hypothetical protein
VTPEQIDTVTNGLIKVHAMADLYGPGLALAAAIAAAVWACRRIAGTLHDRSAARRRRWSIRDLEHYANTPDHPRYTNTPARKEDQS